MSLRRGIDLKQYPSIPHVQGFYGRPCYAFFKYDGSNLRFEWSKKSGWGKFGTRTRLFDHTDPTFGIAIDLFLNKYGSDLEQVFRTDKKIRNAKHVIVFAEFFGPRSFAGQHHPDDSKDLIMFDVNPHKVGLLGPKEFLDTFGHLKVAELVYQGNLNKEFVSDISFW